MYSSLDHILGAGGERDVIDGSRILAPAHDRCECRPCLLKRDPEVCEDSCDRAFAFVEQAREQVHGSNVIVV
jgi:hypothetical protein